MAVKKCVSWYKPGQRTKSGGYAAKRTCKAWSGLAGIASKCVAVDKKGKCIKRELTPIGVARKQYVKSFGPSNAPSMDYSEGVGVGGKRGGQYSVPRKWQSNILNRPPRISGGPRCPQSFNDEERAACMQLYALKQKVAQFKLDHGIVGKKRAKKG
jgi:hypothetical protein